MVHGGVALVARADQAEERERELKRRHGEERAAFAAKLNELQLDCFEEDLTRQGFGSAGCLPIDAWSESQG